MKKLLILFLLPVLCQAQVDTLKPEFRNLSWVIDSKSTEVVSTLAHYFSVDSLMKQGGDTSFVSQKEYNFDLIPNEGFHK